MDKQALKAHYGFDVSSKVGLVVFGGGGGEDMLSIQEALMDKPLVLICGSNYRLASKLTGRATGSKHLVLSSVTNMHLYTRLCDYFVGKPGTNCILEATICKLPLIVANVGKDSPHEITGLNYVKENSLGMAVSDFTNIRQNVEQLLSNADTYIANMTKQQITSVFEIPDVIEKIGRQT
jgi:UDP-N-acetylglucosamine:LPS N-acetylglucosamine transferase